MNKWDIKYEIKRNQEKIRDWNINLKNFQDHEIYLQEKLRKFDASEDNARFKRALWINKNENIEYLRIELLENAKSLYNKTLKVHEKNLPGDHKEILDKIVDLKKQLQKLDIDNQIHRHYNANLKKFVWKSKDQKIIDLREQALLIIKLILDKKENK